MVQEQTCEGFIVWENRLGEGDGERAPGHALTSCGEAYIPPFMTTAGTLREPKKTPFDFIYEEQTLAEALAASVRCARQIEFFRGYLPDAAIASIDDFLKLPLSSRVELSMAGRLGELILDPRLIFRSVYPFHQNACTFPFQIVAGDKDLFIRHERMTAILEAAGFPKGGETLVLATPPQFFFASDLCAEIFFEGHHCSIQDISGMDSRAIRRRIDDFGAKIVLLCTDSTEVTRDAIGDDVEAVLTFRGAYAEMAELDATVVDIYTLSEALYLGYRRADERFYHYNHDHFFLERSPQGLLTITTLLWEAMPFIRYQTYDLCRQIDDAEGLFEIRALGEW